MIASELSTSYEKISTYIWHGALCCQINNRHYSCLFCMCKNQCGSTYETIQNCKLVYSINREKPHQPITFSFVARIHSEHSDQMFILSEMVCQVAFTALQKHSILLMKLLKLIASLYSNKSYT